MEQSNQQHLGQPATLFDLVRKVGSAGFYQKISMILWCVIWFITGNLLLGIPFLFYHDNYECSGKVPSSQCFNYVCSLIPSDRQQYIHKSASILSIANFKNDDYCQNHLTYQILSSMIYFGCFFGYIILSIFADNFGRKVSMVISMGITLFGMIMAVSTGNLVVIGFGLFLTGFGSDTTVNICFYFISETVEDHLRQKYSILIQSFFCLGGIGSIFYYYTISNWKTIFWYFHIIPWLLCIIALLFYIEQTPMFLLSKKTSQAASNALNRIAMINKGQPNIITIQQIQNIKHKQLANQSENKSLLTPFDLIKHRSIRFISIYICSISFILYLLYYGPLMLLESFGLNIYLNDLVVNLSELITYFFSFPLIHKIPRRYSAFIFFGVALLCSFILIFIKHQQACNNCTSNYFQLILIFIFRFCISMEFSIFLVYCNQLFPSQIRGMGIGISSAIGTIASTIAPILFGQIQNTKFPPNIIFLIGCVLAIIFSYLLPETKNKPLKQFIDELDIEKSKKNIDIELVQQIEPSQQNKQYK